MNTNTSEANYRRVRVVVIGAGASGLQCANQLLQVDGENDNTSSIRPEDILILEARDRIGGRIHSTLETRKSCGNDSSQVQFYMDHGAAWIHGTGGDWPYFNPQPDLLESTAAALEENPMMELLKQVSAPDENVCEAHLNPTFKEGNPWMRPNHVLLKQKQLVLFVKGTQIGGSGCDSSSKASESSSEDDKIFSEALELHKNIMADVARIGYDLVSNGKTVDAVTQSFQTALDTVLASEKDNLLISTNNNPLIPLVAGFYRHLISCWHATDASDLQLYEFSAFDPGNETDEAVDDEYVDEGDFYGPHCTMKRGMETVLQPLVEKVLPCVRLNEPVISVGREQLITSVTGDNRNRSVRVETATGLVVEADCCVVTVSQGCLADALTKKEDDEQHQNQGNTTICFAEELSSQKIEAVENICMGSYKKVFLTFDHIFWPKYEAFIGLVREQQGSNKLLVEDHLGDNLLLDNLWARHDIPCIEAVLIGEAAVWATGKSDDIIRDAVLKFFSDTMGLDFETQPKEWCMDCHVTRWEEDPYSRGAYSGYRLGTSPRHTEGLASSEWGRQLVFAGEATVSGYEGSVHAALLSGKRAAKEVKDWLNSAAHRQQPDPKTSTNITHTIAVVAKCPIPGKSKTRLLGMLGEQGSAKLARAMLSDVLTSLSETVRI